MRYYPAPVISELVMTYQRIFLAMLCLFALSGCGGSSKSEAPPEPPPVKDTVFGDMVGTMDKARGVQDTVNTQKQDLDKQVETAETPADQ